MRVLTQDLFAAAFLVTRGAHVAELFVDRTPTRASGTFALEGKSVLEDHEAFCRGEAVCRVRDLRDAVSHMRACLARALRQPAPGRSRSLRTASL